MASRGQDASNGGLHSEDENSDLNMEESPNLEVEGPPPHSPAWPTISDVHRALRPLQAEADRVGKQVEQFAEILDRLSNDKREKPQSDSSHALRLVDGYRKIARSTVEYLQEIHAPEKQKRTSTRLENKSRLATRDSAGSSTLEDLERWQHEEQTWHLVGLMLQLQYPSSETDNQPSSSDKCLVRPSKGVEINQYSSESDVWSHFLAHDDLAWERHAVVEWLKTCANGSGQAIDEVIQYLETNADRGSGLWAHSWLYTKEAIKGQKRLRSWPQALAPDSPGIDVSLRNSDRTRSLITQLDPDAVTRQDRSLELQDENFERATWLACWEMVRRGEDWDFIRAWCQERVENWRAIAVRGDPRHHASNMGKAPSDPSASWQSRTLWRKVCALAAQTDGMDRYEAAVYGIVSGYLPSIQKVCGSWNDCLFAHYNCYLLRAFDEYIARNFSGRLPRGLNDNTRPFNINMTGGHAKSGNHMITLMKKLKSVSKEAKGSFKLLQGSLIGKTFDDFVQTNGAVLSQTLHRLNRSKRNSKFLQNLEKAKTEGKIPAWIQPDDYQIIRIVTHIALICLELGLYRSKNGYDSGAENFIEAYITFLGKAGKQQLLPLYASRLSPERAISCMSREIRLIVEHGERQTMMRLMKQYGIDLPRVLKMQLQLTMKKSEANEQPDLEFPTPSILDSKRKGEMRTVKDGFMGQTITDDQHDLINGFEWYLLLDGYWEQTVILGAVLYTYFLKLAGSKGLAAAKEMSKRVSFSSLSLRKTKAILGREIDVREIYNEDGDVPAHDNRSSHRPTGHGRSGSGSTGHHQTAKEQYLSKRSKNFRNLEQLIHALSALEDWQAEVNRKPQDIEMSSPIGKKWRDSLRKACESVEASIEPLLHGWLQYPHDELGATVAAPDSDLAGCFVSSKRMSELVDALAVTSMNMLVAEEYGIGSKKLSAKMGLWNSKSQSSAAS
ncbi:MAG: hypothetical protein Q9166_004454 [cf. Caloplaca sp. 2 TL-2023]